MVASFPTKPGQINLDKQVVGLLGAPRRIESSRESRRRPLTLAAKSVCQACENGAPTANSKRHAIQVTLARQTGRLAGKRRKTQHVNNCKLLD